MIADRTGKIEVMFPGDEVLTARALPVEFLEKVMPGNEYRLKQKL